MVQPDRLLLEWIEERKVLAFVSVIGPAYHQDISRLVGFDALLPLHRLSTQGLVKSTFNDDWTFRYKEV